jgi:mannose-6-phosphate isomerase
MQWHPLRLTTPFRTYGFGGRAIIERLGKRDLPLPSVAETWEVSDVDGNVAVVREGALAGHTLRELTRNHGRELVGRNWRGERFPILTNFLDAAAMLPVHLHASDDVARRIEHAPNGKSEAWHILDADPGASVLVGLRDGVDTALLRDALLRQDYDSVIRRIPVRAGDTVYVPGGTLHTFGPDTLIYAIQQTSDISQHAMPFAIDGTPLDTATWHHNIDMLITELDTESRPVVTPGLRIPAGTDADRTFLCAGPYFGLERWRIGGMSPYRHGFDTALILSNVGDPVKVVSGDWQGELRRGERLLLPAVLGEVGITGPADILAGYLPDVARDVVEPLTTAGYGPDAIAALGPVGRPGS